MNPALKNSFEIAVIGGGPAGITAAAQATRIGADAALFEREKLGGLIRCANLIENFPGFYGKDGAEVARMLEAQAKSIGVHQIRAEVRRLSALPNGAFLLETNGGEYTADAVIVATGTKPRKIAIPGLPEGAVRYGIDEPREFSGKEMIIIGGGDAAFDQALRISKFAYSVKVICRSKAKALPLLVDRCAAAGIKIHENAEITGGEIVDGRITLRTSAGEFHYDELLAFCGREPNDELLRGVMSELADSTEKSGGSAGAASACIETEIPGLYFAGDIIAGRRRQLAIAVGTGMDAALEAVEYLSARKAAKATTVGADTGGAISNNGKVAE